MSVDPEIAPLVELVATIEQPPPSEETVPQMREAFAALTATFGPGSTVVQVSDVDAPAGLSVRTYCSTTPQASPGALVWFHGGGWVIGDLDTHDSLCRDLAAATGRVVLSPDYRLAPEHRYPAAHDDAEVVVRWVLEHADELGVDPRRVALGGDSAGGHLATVTARRLRDRPPGSGGLDAQVLVYPVTDLAGDAVEHPSRLENGTGYLLSTEVMDFFTRTYLPDETLRDEPDASPLRAPDLSALPPALVVTAGFDPLRDEGVAYAGRLDEAGVETVHEHLEAGVHLCAQMGATGLGRRVIALVAHHLAAPAA